jgi:hypothetical protein
MMSGIREARNRFQFTVRTRSARTSRSRETLGRWVSLTKVPHRRPVKRVSAGQALIALVAASRWRPVGRISNCEEYHRRRTERIGDRRDWGKELPILLSVMWPKCGYWVAVDPLDSRPEVPPESALLPRMALCRDGRR